MNKSMKVFGFIAVLAMVVSGFAATVASADITSESAVKSSPATIYVPDNYTKIQWAIYNATAGDTIIVRDGTYTENINVNKRLTIRSENGSKSTTVQAASSNDHIFELTADYVNISGFTITGSTGWGKVGIYLYNADYCNISTNKILNNRCGIKLFYSLNNIIIDNGISNNNVWGIDLVESSNNNIINNSIVENEQSGITIWYDSIENTIEKNYISDNKGQGIWAVHSSNNEIINNYVLDNNQEGIGISASQNWKIKGNNILNNIGGIFLVDSWDNNIMNNNISFNNYGILYFENSSNSSISNNIIQNNTESGICFCLVTGTLHFHPSNNNNIIINNNILGNNRGISINKNSNNIIYLNNFIDNTQNVRSSKSSNIWNSSEKITYTYNSSQYTNYLGNYWDDYEEVDADGDGIGDTPYSMDSDNDSYPLMVLWENYFAPAENIFDTGVPANPYQSIMGTHKGTIKPYHDVNVSRMYTHPCAGTGGHSESVRIYRSGIDVNGTRNGYTEDWHNITFNESFTLKVGEIYNYTIRTGSYPQIIHKQNHTTLDGSLITCEEFIDVNGRKYNGWIPAIMLE